MDNTDSYTKIKIKDKTKQIQNISRTEPKIGKLVIPHPKQLTWTRSVPKLHNDLIYKRRQINRKATEKERKQQKALTRLCPLADVSSTDARAFTCIHLHTTTHNVHNSFDPEPQRLSEAQTALHLPIKRIIAAILNFFRSHHSVPRTVSRIHSHGS